VKGKIAKDLNRKKKTPLISKSGVFDILFDGQLNFNFVLPDITARKNPVKRYCENCWFVNFLM